MSRPRMRTLKPETWQSADVLALTNLGALLWVVLITIADDTGRIKTSAKHLTVTYLRSAPTRIVQGQLDVMESRGMIRQYLVDGVSCIALVNWNEHQRVDHPQPSKIPAPPEIEPELPLDLDSPIRERSRTFANSSCAVPVPIRALSNQSKDVREIGERLLAAWQESTGTQRAKLTPPKLAHVRARLREGWTESELLLVVTDGWRNDPWPERVNHAEFEVLLRSSSQVEKFLKLAVDGAPRMRPKPSYASELRRSAAEMEARGE